MVLLEARSHLLEVPSRCVCWREQPTTSGCCAVDLVGCTLQGGSCAWAAAVVVAAVLRAA